MSLNTLKAKIILFFFLIAFLIFSALAALILRMERNDRIQDLRALLHHVSREIILDHLDPKAKNLDYLKRIEVIRALTVDRAISNPIFKIIPTPRVHPKTNRVSVISKLPNGKYFLISSDTTNIDRYIKRLTATLYLLFFGAFGLLSLLFYLILRRLLEPMEQLARACAAIDVNGDPTYFPLDSESVEIERLRFALQSLMDRITYLRNKEHQMFKETAHQFKTPMAVLKARLDRYALDPSVDKKRFIEQANRDLEKLLKHLKELLIVHENQFPHDDPRVTLDIQPIISELCSYAAPLFTRKSISIDFKTEETFSFQTHPKLFRQLILTVLENCVNHAPESSTVSILLDPRERKILFENLVVEHAEPVLFNSHLGLNIIRELSTALDIKVSVEKSSTHFTLSLMTH